MGGEPPSWLERRMTRPSTPSRSSGTSPSAILYLHAMNDFLAHRLLQVHQQRRINEVNPTRVFSLVNGVPGCGKSSEICRVATKKDLIAVVSTGKCANTSIIDTTTNSAIGEPLRSWDQWPAVITGATGPTAINFDVTIPDTLRPSCNKAGKCVMQWYWYAVENEQTYESCVDFVSA
ncbi:uncharacterized protein B0H64DRAFT_446675 [Chaetomium fimeti]|uniref:Chitin-binding type-4 domain-containing protein n=1 Tax=Chaetomium fimeti TaxID=1854472 RepID=A0AAE0LN05_9PEZI|nr:hypothetical protein B0H64DRAFT_446675 [Chaetomium fimeti]